MGSTSSMATWRRGRDRRMEDEKRRRRRRRYAVRVWSLEVVITSPDVDTARLISLDRLDATLNN